MNEPSTTIDDAGRVKAADVRIAFLRERNWERLGGLALSLLRINAPLYHTTGLLLRPKPEQGLGSHWESEAPRTFHQFP
jgi:hypothetical protein